MPEQRSRPKDGRVIALANQKGGTGKTTTTVNLGIGLARLGQKVLLIDADPQGDPTTCLGWQDQDSLQTTLATIMEKVIRDEPFSADEGILHHQEGVDLMPANIELSAMEMSLVNAMSREFTLRTYVNEVKKNYDTVLIDCMPSLGMITINALAAADSVIIPVQAHYLPAKGMTQLMRTIGKVKRQINPSLKVDGVLLTLVDGRTNLAKQTAETLRQSYGWQGNADTSWNSNNPDDANEMAGYIATQLLVWETVVGERDSQFNHVDANAQGKNNVAEYISSSHPLRSQIFSQYSAIESAVKRHTMLPSFFSGSPDAGAYELKWDGEKYSVTLRTI